MSGYMFGANPPRSGGSGQPPPNRERRDSSPAAPPQPLSRSGSSNLARAAQENARRNSVSSSAAGAMVTRSQAANQTANLRMITREVPTSDDPAGRVALPQAISHNALRQFILNNNPSVAQLVRYIRSQDTAVERGNMTLSVLEAANLSASANAENLDNLLNAIEHDRDYLSATHPIAGRLSDHFAELYSAREAGKKIRNRKEEARRKINRIWNRNICGYTIVQNTCTSDHALRSLAQASDRRDMRHFTDISNRVNRFALDRMSHPARGVSNIQNLVSQDWINAAGDRAAPQNPQGLNVEAWGHLYGLAPNADQGHLLAPVSRARTVSASSSPQMTAVITNVPSGAEVVLQARHLTPSVGEFYDFTHQATGSPTPGPGSPVGHPIGSPVTPGTGLGRSMSNLELRETPQFEPKCTSEHVHCNFAKVTQEFIMECNVERLAKNSLERCEYLMSYRDKAYGQRSTRSYLCNRHLRRFSKMLGLASQSADNDTLHSRIQQAIRNVKDSDDGDLLPDKFERWQCSPAVFSWWWVTARPRVPTDDIGVYRYFTQPFHLKKQLTAVDRAIVLEALQITSAMIQAFEDTGTANFSTGIGSNTRAWMKAEFNLYKWHSRIPGTATSTLGWLRNMYFSQAQQYMRQDLGYYLANCATRPDLMMWLLSSPYYTKYTENGDHTQFRHIDFNVREMALNGRGLNQVQGSFALDNENNQNCTVIVKRMHKPNILQAWVQHMDSIGSNTAHFIKKIDPADLPQEFLTRWNLRGFECVPCTAGEVRISHSSLPHGSTGPATGDRRNIFNWYVRLDDDHATAEVSAGPNWEELSKAHRDMTAPPVTPSGLPYLFGKLPYKFPAAIQLIGGSPVQDALVGRKKWSDFDVQSNIRTLLLSGNTNREKAQSLRRMIAAQRTLLENRVRANWTEMVRLEKEAFGLNSFFLANPTLATFGSITSSNCDSINWNARPAAPAAANISVVASDEDFQNAGVRNNAAEVGHE
jgi:hypothetical protein